MDSLNKAETVLKFEGIKAGLATATPQDQKQLLGERLFPQIQRMNSGLAGKLTGMMLEKSNEKILQMIENRDYLREEVGCTGLPQEINLIICFIIDNLIIVILIQ